MALLKIFINKLINTCFVDKLFLILHRDSCMPYTIAEVERFGCLQPLEKNAKTFSTTALYSLTKPLQALKYPLF